MSEKRKKRILRLCLVFLVLLSASIAFLLPRPMNEPQDNTVAVNDGHGTIRIEPIPGLPASTLRRSEFTHRDNAITYTGMEYRVWMCPIGKMKSAGRRWPTAALTLP